ncbi:ABC transporter ATP-binding protein [Staphylococcus durrellii]|uniref:ABC transporter ATP-binding protein n=1 Tax=Staphylococcus durrellii TaxID=2781773 RepID=UPI001F179412|nr:ATP-binding cassette domain-containing protein [Staphylococcus durrellii]
MEEKTLLKIEDVSYIVDDRTIIDDISFTINKGETIAVIGPSGSGKSTLFRLMSNLISPTKGSITLNGTPYEQIKPEELRMKVSYLLQQSDLFEPTIGLNLSFPARVRNDKFDKKRAKKLLKHVGLGHYDLNASVEHLSGGERQRITIARQLMYIPQILLLDEATSALDAKNRDIIEKMIFDLANDGVTIMWITHNDDQSMRHFSKRIKIVNGKIESEENLS